MKKTKKAIATLAIAGMALSMIPFNALADSVFPTRLGGMTAEQTAVQIADQTGWKDNVVLSSSTSYGMVDALTASPLATFLKAPILLTGTGDTLNPDTKAELTKLKVKTVYVTSGTAVISQKVLDEMTSMGITVVSLGGVDRFATSVNIAKKMVELGAPVSKAAVVFGWLNQDALSIASIASAQNEPILLTEKDSIPASVKEFLNNNPKIKTTDVIGGTGVISDDVKAQLPNATRFYGQTAYDTNLAVLKGFDSVLKYDHVFLANGETGIDALTGAPLAAQYHAGIVLTNGTSNDGTAYVKGKMNSAGTVTALGGTAVVPDVVRTGTVSTTAPVVTGGGGGGSVGGGGGGGGGGSVYADKSSLQTAVNNANTLIDSHRVGTLDGNVSQAAHDAFQSAINNAASVLNNSSATQAQVDAQVAALATATTNFNNAIIEVITSQAQAIALIGTSVHNPIIVTTDNITLTNFSSDSDITVDGNNDTLDNIVEADSGTIYLNPGPTGSTTVQNVTANNIVVLSGGQHSINLVNVIAKMLQNRSSDNTHIHLSGGSVVQQTESTVSAIFEAEDGTFGTVTITIPDDGSVPTIELQGNFTEPIVVGGGVKVVADPGANVPEVQVKANKSSQPVTLTGNFNKVTTDLPLQLGGSSSVANVIANSNVNIDVPASSSITLDKSKSSGTTTTGGGTVLAADKTGLKAALDTAQNLYNNTTTGTAIGCVPQTAQVAYKAAIDIATLYWSQDNPTQNQINTQLQALATATVNFNNAIIKPASKTALSAAIDNANTLIQSIAVGTTAGKVTQKTHDAYAAAIVAASTVNNDPNATQSQVDAAVKALAGATTDFNNGIITGQPTDYSLLNKAVSDAQTLIGSKTVGTAVGQVSQAAHDAYQKAINAATSVMNDQNATQAQVYAQVTALASATGDFNRAIIKLADKTALNTAITNATTLLNSKTVGTADGNVSQGAHDTYQAAINSATSVSNDPNATQAQADAAVAALASATTDFNNAVIIAGSQIITTLLSTSINNATALIGSKTVGTDVGNVPQAASDAFQAAINSAANVLSNQNATQAQVDAAVIALANATIVFNNAVIQTAPVSKTALSAAIEEATTLLASKTIGTATGNVSQDTHDALKAAIDAATAVMSNPIATQAQVDAQAAALSSAETAFTNAVITNVPADYSALTAAIGNATTLIAQQVAGIEAHDPFQQAIETASSVLNNPNATQSQVDYQVQALNTATTVFNSAVANAPMIDISSIPGADLTGDTLTLSFSQITTSSAIGVTKNSNLSFDLGAGGIIGDIPMTAGQKLALLNCIFPTTLNVKNINLTNIFAAIQQLDPATKQQIFANVNFTQLFNLIKTAQPLDSTTSSSIKETILSELNLNDLFAAIRNSDPSVKQTIFNNLFSIISIAVQDPATRTSFQQGLMNSLATVMANNDLTPTQYVVLLNYISTGYSTPIDQLFSSLALTDDQKSKIFADINYTTLFNTVRDDLSSDTKSKIFDAIDFASILNAIMDAKDSTDPTALSPVYDDMVKVIDTILNSSISRVDVLNALGFGGTNKVSTFEALYNLNQILNHGTLLTVKLTDTATPSITSTFYLRVHS